MLSKVPLSLRTKKIYSKDSKQALWWRRWIESTIYQKQINYHFARFINQKNFYRFLLLFQYLYETTQERVARSLFFIILYVPSRNDFWLTKWFFLAREMLPKSIIISCFFLFLFDYFDSHAKNGNDPSETEVKSRKCNIFVTWRSSVIRVE